jgi:hypothetical protein
MRCNQVAFIPWTYEEAFESHILDNGFGGNPRVDDESMSTIFAL